MNNKKISMRILTLLAIIFLYSCGNPNNRSENAITDSKQPSSPAMQQKVADSVNADVVRTDNIDATPKKYVPVEDLSRIPVARIEEGINDDKLNGEPIIIQIDLPENIYRKHTDTIESCANQYYTSMEQFFPRAIADDFEHGISTEHVAFPTLNFTVQLFENEYAEKPYKTVSYTIFNERDKAKIAKEQEVPVYEWADQMPVIKEGNQDIRVYLESHIAVPKKVKEQGISGISWLTFIVEKDGSLSDVRIQKEFTECIECDQEVLKLANSLPPLNPAKMNGQVVRYRLYQGIRF
jgi:hypothetical protein